MLVKPIVIFFIFKLVFVSSLDVIHVGCYSYSEIALYKSGITYVEPYSWDKCVHLCLEKLTVFAAASDENRVCICHNRVPDLWTLTDVSQCEPCAQDASRYCGGWATLSLYRLSPSDTPPTALLLATERGIEKYIPERSTSFKTLLSLPEGATLVDFHYRNNEIYFVSATKMYKSSYNFNEIKYNDPELVVEANCTIIDLAVDWRHYYVYYVCTDKIYKRSLCVGDFDSVPLEITGEKSNFYFFESDPYERDDWFIHHNDKYETETGGIDCVYLFNHSSGLLHTFTYSESTSAGNRNRYQVFGRTKQFALDSQLETVYAIASFTRGGKEYLISMTPEPASLYKLYDGFELWDFFALEAFNETLIWGVQDITNYTLFRGVVIENKLRDVSIIHTGPEKINNIKIYHSEFQNPSGRYLCGKKNCSHTCSIVSAGFVRCVCPENSVLANDDRTCVESPTDGFDMSSTPNTELFDESTMDTEELVTIEESEENISEKGGKSVDQTPDDEVLPTKTTTEVKTQNHGLYIIFICVMIFLAIFITLAACYALYQKKNCKPATAKLI